MDYQVNWSLEAVEDVEEIARYIEKDSLHYAQAVVDDIVAASRSLRQLAIRGHQIPEIEDDDYRELFVYSYRLIYRIKEQQILVIAVIHGKRQLENIEDRFTS